MKRRFAVVLVSIVFAGAVGQDVSPVRADVKTAALRETIEYVTKKFSKEAAEEGVEAFSRKVEQLAARHGDDALQAVRNVGPRALRIAEEAGEHGAAAVRAMSRYGDDGVVWIARRPQGLELATKYGDDAAAALVKHQGIAEKMIAEGGEAAVRALRAVDTPQAIRLAQMAADPATAALARNGQLLDVVARYGDRAMDFIWRNKGALTVTAALAAFVSNPQPFLDGTADLAQTVGENVILPLASIPGKVAESAARSLDWTIVVVAAMMLGSLGLVWRNYRRNRAAMTRGSH